MSLKACSLLRDCDFCVYDRKTVGTADFEASSTAAKTPSRRSSNAEASGEQSACRLNMYDGKLYEALTTADRARCGIDDTWKDHERPRTAFAWQDPSTGSNAHASCPVLNGGYSDDLANYPLTHFTVIYTLIASCTNCSAQFDASLAALVALIWEPSPALRHVCCTDKDNQRSCQSLLSTSAT